uniref:Phosphate transporter n=1 Tax=Aureoumbra lagunensis TaxID=44058 RepID=A0A6S8CWL2_9STRA|mmetsp:Transcript_5479/g.7715  ORF Transcript_5479/g.7715 Transcript_5479/m.7715 type:complete len:567 (+) Transcript_5479:81-1781(+)|eukprot:CAMPEP_0197291250 /NCGR_PEP_ID=MMETSP0890-20130614/11786_1 /TAXON_ID=44058 ORGANISM="Aureoumbra lagunensis, Strain CCMP1510" /NCGR_SAMPLE_ID=MMETSP0890 /ASSEMBLY_ACC=CAM_ASM_000533 /LENGTH=566 /DNA_ID=CAMNT_0042763919 /DNA_START=60 /DNA_END=1760 /DNA_ORIENTATION=-
MIQMTSTVRGFLILTGVAMLAESARNDDFVQRDYLWLIICAAILAFVAAYGIGANDVANAFATSVGAKAISVRTAVLFASVFEFAGAVLMGSSVSKTIRKGIADVACFEDNPGLLIYGMTCVILSVAVWLLVASYFEMPVSTTHSAVGGIIGMTLMSRGHKCVIWNFSRKDYGNGTTNYGFDNFPWLDGVAEIAVSWVLSPVASGFCAAVLYSVTKYGILVWDTSYLRARIFFPLVVFFTAAVNTAFWIIKGTAGRPKRFRTSRYVRESKDGNLASSVELACIVGACCAFVSACLVIPMTKWVDEEFADGGPGHMEMKDVEASKPTDEEGKFEGTATASHIPDSDEIQTYDVATYVKAELERDPHACLNKDETVKGIHDNATVFDPKTEAFFRYVQVFTAMVDSFSHGANDVANAMGPFAASYIAWKRGSVKKEHDLHNDMTWILAIGGVGIVVGLATYGYKIMTAMGVKLAAVTPSRGYCIELGAAFVIIYGTAQGWPLSTTHCQVGATVAVGLFEGSAGVNGRLLLKTAFGWVITLAIVGSMAAFFVGPNPEPLKPLYCPNYEK